MIASTFRHRERIFNVHIEEREGSNIGIFARREGGDELANGIEWRIANPAGHSLEEVARTAAGREFVAAAEDAVRRDLWSRFSGTREATGAPRRKHGFLWHTIRGCGRLPSGGEHPGTAFLCLLTVMGGIAGARGGWKGALMGAGVMLAVFGPIYLSGAYSRSRCEGEGTDQAR